MPVDWSNPDEISQYRQSVISQGADPSETEKYIKEQSANPPIKLQDPTPLPTANLNTSVPSFTPSPTEKSIETQAVTPYQPPAVVAPKPSPQSVIQPTAQPTISPQPTSQQASQPSMGQQTMSPIPQVPALGGQNGVLPQPYKVTQYAGTRNPVEQFSRGYSRDTNFAAPMGTPVALPPGQWKVMSAYGNAPTSGGARGENLGYGNAVKVVDTKTGNSMIFQHLGSVKANPGQVLNGGQVIATTGNSGNSTGPNLGIEYADQYGRIREVTQSPYSQYLFSK